MQLKDQELSPRLNVWYSLLFGRLLEEMMFRGNERSVVSQRYFPFSGETAKAATADDWVPIWELVCCKCCAFSAHNCGSVKSWRSLHRDRKNCMGLLRFSSVEALGQHGFYGISIELPVLVFNRRCERFRPLACVNLSCSGILLCYRGP